MVSGVYVIDIILFYTISYDSIAWNVIIWWMFYDPFMVTKRENEFINFPEWLVRKYNLYEPRKLLLYIGVIV